MSGLQKTYFADFYFDLQLFAEEKTERATPRRRQEARKRGQVIRSSEINSALILLLTFLTVYLGLPYFWEEWKQFTVKILSGYINASSFSQETLAAMLREGLLTTGKMLFPIIGVAFATGLLVSFLQVGMVFSTEGLRLNLERINPIEGFKRIFSKRALVELVKSLLKLLLVGYVTYVALRSRLGIFPQLMELELPAAIQLVNQVTFSLAWQTGLLLLALAGLDYLYQWWEYERALMMSKQELKEEYKQTEGDPQVRSRMRERQRRIAMQRMMSQVPRADVVITNPTHFAVALEYKAEEMAAPRVIAKGQDLIALRIKEIAEKNDIAVVEDPPLAQTLYRTVEIGEEVPPQLYKAVAEILAFVYRLKKRAI